MNDLLKLCAIVILSVQLNVSFGQNSILLSEKVNKIDSFESLYQSGNYYFAGQPSLEAFHYLKEQGIETVINLRSGEENEGFTKEAFNEERLMNELGINYISIPMKGKGAFNPKTLSKFSDAVSTNTGKVLIHCKAAGRVTLVMMAYLIKHHNYSLEQAEAFGSQITYINYLDALLGKD